MSADFASHSPDPARPLPTEASVDPARARPQAAAPSDLAALGLISKALADSQRSLHRLILIILASFLLFGGAAAASVFREVSQLRRQIDTYKTFMANHNSVTVPVMVSFRDQLQTYAETHADFRPILGKYVTLSNAAAPQSLGAKGAPPVNPAKK